jgi:HME family heavy-metal exporter
MKGFAANTSGGFLELNGREYLIRHLGRTRLDDLKNLALTARAGQPILLRRLPRSVLRRRSNAAMPASKASGGHPQHPEAADGGHGRPDKTHRKRDCRSQARLPRHGETQVTFRQARFHRGFDHHAAGQADRRFDLRRGDPVLLPRQLRTTLIALTAIPCRS